jgi:Uncharacterized conserved protein
MNVSGGVFLLCWQGQLEMTGPCPMSLPTWFLAQQKYKEQLHDVAMVLMLASTLHAVAVGNMLPSTVKLVCIDINPASVTKLLDRGSTQAVGVISDIGTFLPLLAEEVEKLRESIGQAKLCLCGSLFGGV